MNAQAIQSTKQPTSQTDIKPDTESRTPLFGLLVAQFFGAFNDNAWKLLVVFLSIRAIPDDIRTQAMEQNVTMHAFVMLTLPLMLFSFPAGLFADRISKRSIIIAMKVLEIILMGAGALTLYLYPEDSFRPLIVLGLMGVQSSLFSPAKYGILPELLPHKKLSAGNAQLEMWTFLAIILGTAAGGFLKDLFTESIWMAGLTLTVLSCIGCTASLFIPPVQAARGKDDTGNTYALAWQAIRGDRVLRLAIIGSVLYWTVASLLGVDIIVYTKEITRDLKNSDTLSGLSMALFGVGVGIGSMLAGRLSSAKVEVGLLPLGAVGLGIFTLLLGWLHPGIYGTYLLMCILGISSGFIIVPLHALLQWRSPADRRGAVIALSNIVVFGGMMIGSFACAGLAAMGLSARGILIVAALATVAGTIWATWLLPEALLRLVLLILTNTIYRLRIVGRENIPETGGALLVPNHVSFVDGLLVLASTDRPVRFIVAAEYYNNKFIYPFAKLLGAIPISATDGPKMILRAFREAGEYLDKGELVCIFAEGQITRIGAMLPFRRGVEKIAQGRDASIIPMNLDRVWGSIFSHKKNKFFFKLPRHIPYPITVVVGQPLPADTPGSEIRLTIQELSEQAWRLRKDMRRPLHHSFIKSARKHPFRFCYADSQRPKVSFFKALTGSIALARTMRKHWQGQKMVGILLPPCVPAALLNIGAAMAGRVSVNLNYTAGRYGMESAANQAGLKTIITSRQFIEKANLEAPQGAELLWLEDIAETISFLDRIKAMLIALFAPARLMETLCGAEHHPEMDDLVTIIFSSGSTGDPKGVMLSHFNIDSNIEGADQIIPFEKDDRLLGILPLFHSFGYTVTLWLACNCSLGVVFHPNPLDAPSIGQLVAKYKVTFMISTATFMQIYMRRCLPEQFGSLKFVIAGAEKLPVPLADAFEQRFGVKPLEGYGTTECAPVVAVNTVDYRAPGFFQQGAKRGSVGRPLPGVSIRIADPETMEPLPVGETGMILVKGPNIMLGYLGREDLTAKAIHDGWYCTGDIGKIDDEGFITITDRLARFSKLGGEMVPHGRVEEALHKALDTSERIFAVTSVSDEQKGERLAVLYTVEDKEIPEVLEKIRSDGLPNLFIPRRENFVKVEELPILGTGKLDLRAIKSIAAKELGG